MNSFILNVAHLVEGGVEPPVMNQYDVEVEYLFNLITYIKAKPVVILYIDPKRLMNELELALNNHLQKVAV